jgi:dephospho-CoA kinase
VPIIGLTGSVGTGKSSFAERFLELVTVHFFDADKLVHELLATNEEVCQQVMDSFGEAVLDEHRFIVRAKLREVVFSSHDSRERLEAILHPPVQTAWKQLAQKCREERSWLLVDLPLLYETNSQTSFDCVIVVAASHSTQKQRLTEKRGLTLCVAESMIDSQFDLDVKIQQADHIIWNDSTVANLDRQTRLLADYLRSRYAAGS